jgi:hypothetical protein
VFQRAYETAWQHPGIAWIAGVPLFVFGLARLRRGPRFWLWCFVVLEVEILADAWFGGALAPKMSSFWAALATSVSIIFGDLRFFFLVEKQARVTVWWRPLRVALPVSLVVPGLSLLLHEHDPSRYDGTFLYLIYELGLLLVVTAFCFIRARNPRPSSRAYLRWLILLECAQYLLWATADVLIQRGVDLGWLLRLVPNAIYYAAFVPLATFNAPEEP